MEHGVSEVLMETANVYIERKKVIARSRTTFGFASQGSRHTTLLESTSVNDLVPYNLGKHCSFPQLHYIHFFANITICLKLTIVS